MTHEIARVRGLANEPSLGAIRLAWWRDALAAIHAGARAEQHPALIAYERVARQIPAEHWLAFIEAQGDWIASAPTTWEEADARVERTEAPVLRLAAAAVGGGAAPEPALVEAAARAWGYLACVLAGRASLLPGPIEEALPRSRAAYAQVRAMPPPPPSLFPAFGHIALTRLYLDALARGRGAVPLLRRQLRLVFASATGRL